MKKIVISELNVEIVVDNNNGKIIKGVKDNNTEGMSPEELQESEALCGALDAIDSLILAHACSGYDVNNDLYVKGIQVALDAIANNL